MKVTLKLPNLKEIPKVENKSKEERRQELVDNYKKWFPNRSIQHILDLDDRYPEVEMFGQQCISTDFGKGWAPLVEEVLKVLTLNECKVGQIKQKFCELRIYWDFPLYIELAIDEWRKKEPKHLKDDNGEWRYDPPMPYPEERKKIADAVNQVLSAMTLISSHTCEDCGAVTEKNGMGFGRRLCHACEKQDVR